MERLKPGAAPTTNSRASRRSIGRTRSRARARPKLAAVLVVTLLLSVVSGAIANAQTIPPTSAPPTTAPTTAPTTSPTTAPPTTGTTGTTGTTATSSTTTSTSMPPSSTTSLPATTTSSTPNGPTTTQPPGSPAANNPTVIEDLKAGSDELTADELDLLQRFLDAQGEVNDITDKLITINQQYLASQQDLLDAISRVADAEERLKRTSEQLTQSQSALDREHRRLQQDAVSAYVGGGRSMSQANAIIKAQNVDELSKSMVYASAVATDDQELVDHYRELKQQVDDLRRQADQERTDATQARDGLAGRQTTLDQQRTALLDTRTLKQESVDEKVKLLAEVEQKKGDFFKRMNESKSSGGDLGARLRTMQAGQVLPTSTIGLMRQPLDRFRLSQQYGCRANALYGAHSCHAGIDMAIPSGEPIHAGMDGVVIMSAWFDGYGNCVVIEHGNGLATLYAHQTANAVEEGDHVASGQIIGYVGSTGNSTGPHLHWEVRVFGEPTDPLPYMRPN